MALIVDSFSDALNQDNFLLKTIVYALPVFLCANFYISKNMGALFFFGFLTAVLLIALLSIGIYNITNNKREILTFNFLNLFVTIIKLFFIVGFYFFILAIIGFLALKFIKIPIDNKYIQIGFKFFVIFFLSDIGFTPYLAFSRKQDVKEAYKFNLIQEASMDLLLALLFMIPQFLIVDAILVGLVWYVLFVVGIPLTSPIFTFYCSFIVVLNVSALSSYLSQIAYTCIPAEDEDYRDNYYLKGNTKLNDKNKR